MRRIVIGIICSIPVGEDNLSSIYGQESPPWKAAKFRNRCRIVCVDVGDVTGYSLKLNVGGNEHRNREISLGRYRDGLAFAKNVVRLEVTSVSRKIIDYSSLCRSVRPIDCNFRDRIGLVQWVKSSLTRVGSEGFVIVEVVHYDRFGLRQYVSI